MSDQQSPTPITTQIKEGISALREGLIVVAIVLLLVEPSFIGRIAEEAGLKSMFGVEFYAQLKQSGDETDNAQAALDALTTEVTQLKDQLQALSQNAGTTETPSKLKQEIKTLANNADKLEKKSNAIRPFLQKSRNIQKDLLGRITNKK